MLAGKFKGTGGRRHRIVTATAVVLILGGVGLISSSIASQHGVEQPTDAADADVPAIRSEEPSSPRTRTLPRSKPVALAIPSIGVHSVVQNVGLTPENALEVPAPGPHYDEAAWYRHSPTPGSLGPAVILGHVDSATGPSVFFRLGEIQRGDRISIARADGSVAVFLVDEVHRYAKNDFPTEVVYGDIDHAGLRILTCGGAFDDSTGHYLDNIVVFASLATAGQSR